jgi:hypothetical protein
LEDFVVGANVAPSVTHGVRRREIGLRDASTVITPKVSESKPLNWRVTRR